MPEQPTRASERFKLQLQLQRERRAALEAPPVAAPAEPLRAEAQPAEPLRAEAEIDGEIALLNKQMNNLYSGNNWGQFNYPVNQAEINRISSKIGNLKLEKKRVEAVKEYGKRYGSTVEAGTPFWKGPHFDGAYFDERRKELLQQLSVSRGLNTGFIGQGGGMYAPPRFSPSKQGSVDEISEELEKLDLQEKIWKHGISEDVYNLPEIGPELGQGAKRFSGALLTALLASEEKDRVKILEKFGWEASYADGFPVVANPDTGQRFILNKPGMSRNDVLDFFALAAQFIPAGRAAAQVGRGAAKVGSWTLLKRAGAGAGYAAGTEVVKQDQSAFKEDSQAKARQGALENRGSL